MCKVMVFTNTKKMNKNMNDSEIIYNSRKMMQDDGFGYSLYSEKGIFTERFLEPDYVESLLSGKISDIQALICNSVDTSTEGVRPIAALGGLLIHGRISTNHRTMVNTHPINKHGWSLIHNGVVEDSGPTFERITTNDSESCLERLATGGIEAIEKHLTGYYAIAAIDPTGKLHIVRDNVASLYCTYVESIDSYIFATTEALISGVCKELGLDPSPILSVKDNIYMIFNIEGSLESIATIVPKGRSTYADSLSYKSLGHTLTDCYGLTEDESSFLAYSEEVQWSSDSSYTFIHTQSMEEISRSEFLKLDDDIKVNEYTVIRPDGTICCPFNYFTERLYA